MKKETFLPFIFVCLTAVLACNSEVKKTENEEPIVEEITVEKTDLSLLEIPEYKKPHEFGGWYCPDNFGFKPVDIQKLEEIKVISDRLPTEEETRNSTSLIYIDSEKFPDAKPLDIKLPQVARMYIHHKAMWELIIIIQAIVVENDTIVGFRFPSGGNGSARLNEVSLLTDSEVKGMGDSPFVYLKSDLKSSKEKVWDAFTKTEYAKELGIKFKKESFFQSKWKSGEMAYLDYDTEEGKATGKIAEFWGNIYLQIDYLKSGEQYTEKMLIGENKENGTADIHFVSGPHSQNFKKELKESKAWFNRITELSNANQSVDFLK